jgi:hypothetical protein
MSVAVKTIPKSTAIVATGSTSGIVIHNDLRRPVAPSRAAASSISDGMDDSPKSMMMVANGSSRQACTAMIDAMASVGSPSQLGGDTGLTRWSAASVQLMTL